MLKCPHLDPQFLDLSGSADLTTGLMQFPGIEDGKSTGAQVHIPVRLYRGAGTVKSHVFRLQVIFRQGLALFGRIINPFRAAAQILDVNIGVVGFPFFIVQRFSLVTADPDKNFFPVNLLFAVG